MILWRRGEVFGFNKIKAAHILHTRQKVKNKNTSQQKKPHTQHTTTLEKTKPHHK